MQESTPTFALIAAFIVGFPLFWMAVLTLAARLGGWANLANQYPAHGPARGDVFAWSSARFGLAVNYGNCLTVTVSNAGIHMLPFVIFRSGHKPILIPWHAVLEVKKHNLWIFSSTKLKIKARDQSSPTTVTFYGKRLTASLEHWSQHR